MLRSGTSICKVLALATLVTSLALTVGSGVAWAQGITGNAPITTNVQPVFEFTYFANARQALDSNVRIVNGGSSATSTAISPDGDLCAMFYVFFREKMSECCGCLVTVDGGRELSINNNLTSNPAGGTLLTKGVIKLVSVLPGTNSAGGETCFPSTIMPRSSSSCPGAAGCPAPELAAWATHVQAQLPNQSFPVSEEEFWPAALSDAEVAALDNECSLIGRGAPGVKGTCSCGAAQ
jgi:hypothetical protein